MTQASLLRPTRKTDAKYLRDKVLEAEGYKDDAETAANTATGQATTATEQNTLATAAKNQAEAYKDATETLKNQAQAIVVSGDTSYTPAANQVPLARSNGKIDPQWIQGAAYPGNAVSAGTATTGILIPDKTQYAFTPAMTRQFDVFLPETMTAEITVFSDGTNGIYITADRKIRINCVGVYESEPIPVYGDYVTIALARNDNEADTVTVEFDVNGVQHGSTIVGDFSDLYIASLLVGVDGWFNVVSPGTTAKTNAGTNKTQLPGDTIGLLKGLSASAINFTQATGTARPLIGRVPIGGERNKRNESYQFESASWIKEKVSVSLTNRLNPIGKYIRKVTPTTESGRHFVRVFEGFPTTENVHSVLAIPDGYSKLRLSVATTLGTKTADYDLGAVSVISADSGVTATIAQDAETGGVRCSLKNNPGANYSTTGHIYVLNDAGENVFSGDGTSGILLVNAQMDWSSEATPDQYRISSRDITEPGVRDCWYAFFDGSDDILTATVPAITNGTIVLAGTNGIWIDSLTVSAGTFSIGPTTYTNGPARVLALIGNYIGAFVINRALTTPERTALVNFFKHLGSPGVFELGAELVNPVDLTDGWITLSAIINDSNTFTSDSTGGSGVYKDVGLELDSVYYFKGIFERSSSGITEFRNSAGSGVGAPVVSANGLSLSMTSVLNAVSSSIYIRNTSGSGVATDINELSLKKITLNTGA